MHTWMYAGYAYMYDGYAFMYAGYAYMDVCWICIPVCCIYTRDALKHISSHGVWWDSLRSHRQGVWHHWIRLNPLIRLLLLISIKCSKAFILPTFAAAHCFMYLSTKTLAASLSFFSSSTSEIRLAGTAASPAWNITNEGIPYQNKRSHQILHLHHMPKTSLPKKVAKGLPKTKRPINLLSWQ